MSDTLETKRYLIKPGEKVRLDRWDPADISGSKGKKHGEKEIGALIEKLDPLQELLYAEHRHSLLIVLQGMDTSGKDATIRRVFEGVNPEGVKVARFGPPTPEEADHDFLWRVHRQAPARGEMVIFNRSHYEGVLIERVHGLVPKEVWKARYEEINGFERTLVQEGTTVVKFYLHMSKKEQDERFRARLDDPTKHWKFSRNDLKERESWSKYMEAYEELLHRTSTEWAPWYLVPSDHGWFRDLLVSTVIVNTLEGFQMSYPKLAVDKDKLAL